VGPTGSYLDGHFATTTRQILFTFETPGSRLKVIEPETTRAHIAPHPHATQHSLLNYNDDCNDYHDFYYYNT